MNQTKTNKKSTREEVEKRVAAVFMLWLNGVQGPDIVAYSTKTWGVGQWESYEYIKRAKALVKTHALVDLKEELGKALLRRESLYQSCVTSKDWRTALAVENDRCELLGLYAPQKVELTDNRENPYAHLNKEQSIQSLGELEALKARTRPHLVPSPKDQGKRKAG